MQMKLHCLQTNMLSSDIDHSWNGHVHISVVISRAVDRKETCEIKYILMDLKQNKIDACNFLSNK